ncbi:HTH-type transcriptional regulator SyrM 1 [Pigmentiphaga humi]|uniref:HTH-type transcriptional regulator SyrM 1 n=2 Tax=Pigmentiphaga humi TaxID=2478468 RepID=A0A3P4B647_9BURK|nr:HTH-type transcriptional regulator SyrM 1 [Pigmentiphaga humi]
MIRGVDFNLLLLFEAIYRTRNLSAAGRAVGISPSAASHALARLRSVFNDPLFVRIPRGLEPTPLSDRLAKQTTTALEAVSAIFDQVAFEPHREHRTFRLAMTDIGEHLLLPRLHERVTAEAPGVRIETCAPPLHLLHEGLESGEVDLALGFFPQIRNAMRQLRVKTSKYVCLVRNEHPVIRDALSLEQYLDASHAIAAPAGDQRGEILERTLKHAPLRGQIAIKVLHFLALPHLVANSDLIATVPSRLAESLHPSWNLRTFDLPLELPRYDVKLYWHERFHQDPGNRWLRGLIAAHYNNE